MKRTFRICLCAVISTLIIIGFCTSAYADPPYTYDENKKAVESASGYEPSKAVFGTDLGVGPMVEPADLFIDDNGNIYILDSGNGRVIRCDSNYKNAAVIGDFTLNGEPSPLNQPSGLYVAKTGTIFIADTANNRVIASDAKGKIQRVYTKPTSELFPQSEDFLPKKVLFDEEQSIFVICNNISRGAVTYSESGNFLGYFGSNRVEVTLSMLADRFWRGLFSRENSNKFITNVAVEFSALDRDSEGFIYSCTANSTSSLNMVRKLNPLGNNIMEKAISNSYQGGFGDLNPVIVRSKLELTSFVDINAGENGVINCLDATKGRVFQYDADANLVFVFGGKGYQMNTFFEPVAIESLDDRIMVLDKVQGCVKEFKRTEFGKQVSTAISLYNQGKYIESVEPWKQVLKMNNNYNLAYVGIGKAMLEMKRYKEAMDNFYLAGYTKGYDMAFDNYRTRAIRDHFYIVYLFVFFILALIYLPKVKPLKAAAGKISAQLQSKSLIQAINIKRQGLSTALGINFHPIEGYSDMIYQKKQSLLISFIFAFLFFITALFSDRYYGFIYTGIKSHTSISNLFLQSVGIMFLFSVINWSVCTLFEGKGRLKDIWIILTYSLQPYIAAQFTAIIMSNILKLDEGVFITYLVMAAQIYSAFLLIKGMEAIHEYSFKRSIWTILFTLLGMALVAILLILIISLVQQIFAFIITVYMEAGLRMR